MAFVPAPLSDHKGPVLTVRYLATFALLTAILGCSKTNGDSQSNPIPFSSPQGRLSSRPPSTSSLDYSSVTHYVPGSARADNHRPLLLFLHGLGGSGRQEFDGLHLAALGARHQSFVLAPDGSVDRERRLFWNAHPACCNFDRQPVDHVSYLDGILSAFTRDNPVDQTRVYVIGFSNGGFMAHRLACEWGDRLAGMASIAGAGPDADAACKDTSRLRVLELHGDADTTVSYEGGITSAKFDSARATFANWAKRMRCTGSPVQSAPIDLLPGIPGAETDTLSHERCPGGGTSLWTVHRGSHRIGAYADVVERAWIHLTAAQH